MIHYEKLASAIYNDVMSGLRGISSNPTMSIEQLEDDIIDERLAIIKEYSLKGIMPKKDLLMSINCITLDCKNIENCSCTKNFNGTPTLHFEIPQLLTEFDGGIEYIGSIDKNISFIWYTNLNALKYHKYKTRGKNKPYVFIDITPNENNMYDCWVFNAPLLKKVSVIGIFKDPRQVSDECCVENSNFTFIDNEIKKRLTEKKLRYYRQLLSNNLPNTQEPR